MLLKSQKQRLRPEYARMSPSPPISPSESLSSNLVTPKAAENEQSRHLLSPPPAPQGYMYDESDVLTNNSHGNSEQMQSAHSSQQRNSIPILDFPLTSPLNEGEANIPHIRSNQSENDQSYNNTPPSESFNLTFHRRRASSFDGYTTPKISLRPRFSTQRPQQRSVLRRDEESSHPNSPYTSTFQQLRLHTPEERSSHERNQGTTNQGHARSHTHSSFFDDVPLEMPSSTLSEPLSMTSRSLFNPIRHAAATSNLLLPPKSNFGYPTNLSNAIPRPIPRYTKNNNNKRFDKSASPPSEKRFCTGTNTSVATATTICALSSSNNSAFGTPSKVTKQPTSPLTSLSDSKTQGEESLDVGDEDNLTFSKDAPKALPFIPICDTRDTKTVKVSYFQPHYFLRLDVDDLQSQNDCVAVTIVVVVVVVVTIVVSMYFVQPHLLGPRKLSHTFQSRPLPFDEVTLDSNNLKEDDKDSPNL